ncbi:MAG: UDP-N-acetylglucosamine 2-epimerase (non-hydrolyzing) [Armatimonadota bacterium]
MKVLTVVGARPQFIKTVPMTAALEAAGCRQVIVHTGQHYDYRLSQIFFDELGIPEPDVNLGVGSGKHGVQTAGMLVGLEEVIQQYHPDWVLLHGDTNSTVAGVLAATKLHVLVAHIEAGLRSFNRKMPEEINRIVVDAISDVLFAPTEEAVHNLEHEGVNGERVYLVGDIMYDAALMHSRRAEQSSGILKRLKVEKGGFILATVHRAENTDDPRRLSVIFDGLRQVAETIPVVLPLHPRTRSVLERLDILDTIERELAVIEPVGYIDMIMLEKSAAVVATDSGGVQKEAFFHKVPCVTLRDETEWVELLDMGWNRICPHSSADDVADTIISAIGIQGRPGKPYGEGRACDKIVTALLERKIST